LKAKKFNFKSMMPIGFEKSRLLCNFKNIKPHPLPSAPSAQSVQKLASVRMLLKNQWPKVGTGLNRKLGPIA
jgi:hypothetical protein